MTVKAILKEDNLRMEKFATVMAIYLILFRGDIDNLPFKIGYNLYAFAAAVMALFMTISVIIYMGMFPWKVSTNPEMFECNMVLFMACLLFSATGMVYMRKRPAVEQYKKDGYVMASENLKEMAYIVFLKKLQFVLWVTLIGSLIFCRIMPEMEHSTAWTVIFGTIGFFVFFFAAYLLQSLIIEDDPEIVSLTGKYLKELQKKDMLTEEEQKILKEKLTEEGIL